MIIVQDVVISDDILTATFQCQLSSCKGACCIKGDYGAPISTTERECIRENLGEIICELSPKSQAVVKQNSGVQFDETSNAWRIACHDDGACVFVVIDEAGLAMCGIEKAFHNSRTDFQKPKSCHLYPIRVLYNEATNTEFWNYDRWDICNSACVHGQKANIPLYHCLKDAIIRQKGLAFYDELIRIKQ